MNHIPNKIELLAPGGDVDSIKAAIVAGADAIYCGLDKFNARNRAKNISIDELHGILRLAHENNCEIFITLNIIVTETEIPALVTLLNKLVNMAIDGIIVQDFGMLYLASTYFPSLKVHASTQLTTHNEGQIKFLNHLAVTRVNLCRELNIGEVQALTAVAHTHDMMTEVFVHGSNCISFSGLCYISSVHSGNSGNRGRCSQSCRDKFDTTAMGKSYPLNLKDNSAFSNLDELVGAGVDSLKIEGRIKKFDYVYTVVNSWRKHLDRRDKSIENDDVLKKVFNRDLSNAFLTGEISKDLFIDNPRDNSARTLAKSTADLSTEGINLARGKINNFRAEVITDVEAKIAGLSIEKIPVSLRVFGTLGEPLKIVCNTFEFTSQSNLKSVKYKGLDYESIFMRLKAINGTAYCIEDLNLDNLENEVMIPFKELTAMTQKIVFTLNGFRKTIAPVEVQGLKSITETDEPSLSILISSIDDLNYCKQSSAVYFKLPDSIGNRLEELVDLFSQNPNLIPWFPAVLIGDDYTKAIEFICLVNPAVMVTNNSGMAHEAWNKGIDWIAGPNFNNINSYSLLCLKEKFNCVGAFASNELNKHQIKQIKKPVNFKLFYSIYHPIELMTSRQCLFHQVSGCQKSKIDQVCISDCQKKETISSGKSGSLIVEKSKGNHHRIYNSTNFLNTDVVADMPNRFDSLFIDLSDVNTATKVKASKESIANIFENLVKGKLSSGKELHEIIQPTTNQQYRKGI